MDGLRFDKQGALAGVAVLFPLEEGFGEPRFPIQPATPLTWIAQVHPFPSGNPWVYRPDAPAL